MVLRGNYGNHVLISDIRYGSAFPFLFDLVQDYRCGPSIQSSAMIQSLRQFRRAPMAMRSTNTALHGQETQFAPMRIDEK